MKFIMDPNGIFFLKFILEGYDNLFILTTLDKTRGEVCITFPSSEKGLLLGILNSLKNRIKAYGIDFC